MAACCVTEAGNSHFTSDALNSLSQRPMAVTVSYQDVTGTAKKMRLDGFQARIFQHEFDHLQGVLFHDRMSPEVLESVKPQLDALEKQFETSKRRRGR
jgi:peptide deformylase